MDCVRRIDFLASRPEVDAARLGMWSRSQGGGLTLATAALEQRLRVAVAEEPCTGCGAIWGHSRVPQRVCTIARLYGPRNGHLLLVCRCNIAHHAECTPGHAVAQ